MTIYTSLAANRKGITYIVFGILLIIRVSSGYISATNRLTVSESFTTLYFVVSLTTLTIFILANKDELAKFNIDIYVIFTFVLSGIIVFLSFGLSLTGTVAIGCSLAIGVGLRNSKIGLNQPGNFLYILLFIAIGITPEILLRLVSPDLYQDYRFFSELSIGTIFVLISITLWNVLFEEMLFRSILWGILNDWKFGGNIIFLTQAFLFWLVHLDLIIDNSLGFPVLMFGIWVGFLTLRSKSLTPSIAAHFVHNITSRLF